MPIAQVEQSLAFDRKAYELVRGEKIQRSLRKNWVQWWFPRELRKERYP